MASIVSSLSTKQEVEMQELFSRRVRLHLLYKSSHHGADMDELQQRFDLHGNYLLIVFLNSDSIRGVYIRQPLMEGKSFPDEETFVFMKRPYMERLRVSVTVDVGSDLICFGNNFHLKLDDGSWYVSVYKDVRGKKQTVDDNVCCVDVELHRVQDLKDILPKPWREMAWQNKATLQTEFVSYKMLLASRPRVKALLLGPVGSGKSSFINSLRSTMYNRFVHLPNVGTAADGFTQKKTTYNIRVRERGPQSVLSLCDVMAVGDSDSSGLSYADALAVIKGHVPDGYKFQNDVPISDTVSGYIADPTEDEQIHCVVFVLDANKMTSYPSSMEVTLRKLHSTISDMGIPSLVLLTHVDEVCLEVKKKVEDVYYSRPVLENMQKAATMMGLPLSYILPVKNYNSMLKVNSAMDILLLSAVLSILHAVDDSLEDQYTFVSVPTAHEKEMGGLFD